MIMIIIKTVIAKVRIDLTGSLNELSQVDAVYTLLIPKEKLFFSFMKYLGRMNR